MSNIQANSTVTFKGTPMVVKGNAKGWLTLVDDRMVEHKVRPSQVEILADAPPKPPKRAKAPGERAPRKIGNSVVRNFGSYVAHKTAEGNKSYDNGDNIAQQLRGMSLDEIYAKASKDLGITQKALHEQYDKLNVGMQRMNLGNRIRGAAKKLAAGESAKPN
jgi:hypothetical protein